MALRYPTAMGLGEDHEVTKNVSKSVSKSVSKRGHNRGGRLPKRTKFVRDVMRVVCSFAP